MKYVYKLDGLGCANCAAKMERTINKIDGIKTANITFMTTKMSIETDRTDIDELEKQMDKEIRRIESQVRMKRV